MTDQAIRQLPNDAALHEFRALVLFALQRYDESAAALYAVLTVGPGWDWATLVGLYPNVSVYTQQLRTLENYCTQNTGSASARFVLAYHYLTQGHTLAALQQLKQVAVLQPQDNLAPQLARQFDQGAAQAGSTGGVRTGRGRLRPGPAPVASPGDVGAGTGAIARARGQGRPARGDLDGSAGPEHHHHVDFPGSRAFHLEGHQSGQSRRSRAG